MSTSIAPHHYPKAPRSATIEDLHGVRVADPFRPLEDPDSDETTAWVSKQEDLTARWLHEAPGRSTLRERLRALWNHERFGLPVRRNGRYFFLYNPGLLDQSVLQHSDGIGAKPQILLDPNLFASDGTAALTSWSPSHDGCYVVYAISRAGSDWREWRVRQVVSGIDLIDRVTRSKFCDACWAVDSSGFYYSAYDGNDDVEEGGRLVGQRLMFHRLGTPQSADLVIYQRPDHPDWGYLAEASHDGRYLVVEVWRGSAGVNQVLVGDLASPGSPLVELMPGFDARYSFVGNINSELLFLTDHNAPRCRLISVELSRPQVDHWRPILLEGPHTLESVTLVGTRLVARYLRYASSTVTVFTLDGRFDHEMDLGEVATVLGFNGTPESSETFFSVTSFNRPTTVFRYDVDSGTRSPWQAPRLEIDHDQFVTRQVFYDSLDGTQISMFVSHRADLDLNRPHPAQLYGYGGFNVSLTPTFLPADHLWMEQGGVYAVANLRGGGEYGSDWHHAGMRERKQNVFDDFIAAAEWLIAAGLTDSTRLAIVGASNGGLLVGACLTQRPDLFAAACVNAAVLDMLRFHRFTIGWAWVPEYGNPDDDSDFAFLYKYSPLHCVQPGTAYPATLIATSDHDDRVVPAHGFKFAAALQENQAGTAPILLRVERKAGHGLGKPIGKLIEEHADRIAFLARVIPGVVLNAPSPIGDGDDP